MPIDRSKSCDHFIGVQHGTTCNAGIDMLSFNGGERLGFLAKVPCFGECSNRCRKYKPPTAEELAEREREIQEAFQRISILRKLIAEECPNGGTGTIVCPHCGGTVRYSRASYNGHIHAKCSTEGCASWME